EAGVSRDGGRAQAARRAVSVGVRNAQILGQRGVDAIGIVDTLEHARVADARLVIHRRPDRAAIADHRLLAGDHYSPWASGACADRRLRQVAWIEGVGVFPTEPGEDGGSAGSVIGADIELIHAVGLDRIVQVIVDLA